MIAPCRRILLVSLLASTALIARADNRPNVLFIALDDLRDWTGYIGHNPQVKTPNLDRLARMGMAFNRAYPAAPVCNASRAALMSGLPPHDTGVYDNNNDWRTVISPDLTLTTAFRKAGYYVCGSGKIYHEAYPRRSEWDDYLPMEIEGKDPRPPPGSNMGVGGIKFAPLDVPDSALADYRIADYGIAELAKKHDRPFFLAVGLHKPHQPWFVPRKYFDLFPLETVQLPPYLENDLDDIPPAGIAMAKPQGDHAKILKSGRWKDAVQGYLATIAYTDMNVGRILDAYENSPEKDHTIIVVWGDHGWHLGEKHHWRKYALWEEATRTPFIWVVPGLTKPGSVSNHPVDLMTIFPTLTKLCGIPTPAHVQGRDLRPLLADPAAPWTGAVLTTYKFENHAIRAEGWRYIRYADGGEELYDEKADPNEWTNLALLPAYAAKKAEFKALLPAHNAADIGGDPSQGAEDFGDGVRPRTKQTPATP